jgi:hypothetical protein
MEDLAWLFRSNSQARIKILSDLCDILIWNFSGNRGLEWSFRDNLRSCDVSMDGNNGLQR